jgi:Cyclic nucleotide-binding domain
MTQIVDRFTGEDGPRILGDALSTQPTLHGIPDAVEELIGLVELRVFAPGATILKQNESDNHIGFILAGSVSIIINGRLINSRKAGQHIGEMAFIDASTRRSATVVAVEETVIGVVTEPVFSSIANRYPKIWRRLAIELGDRLRQRTKGIIIPNEFTRINPDDVLHNVIRVCVLCFHSWVDDFRNSIVDLQSATRRWRRLGITYKHSHHSVAIVSSDCSAFVANNSGCSV